MITVPSLITARYCADRYKMGLSRVRIYTKYVLKFQKQGITRKTTFFSNFLREHMKNGKKMLIRNLARILPRGLAHVSLKGKGQQTVEMAGMLIVSAMFIIACYFVAQAILPQMFQTISAGQESQFKEEEPSSL